MQGFKPLYPLGGKAALAHVTTLFREAGAREVVVVSGHNGDAVDAAALAAGARPVRNACFAHGMFSSVQTGVAALRPGADAFFLLPVDIPLVRPATVRALLDTWGNAACTVAHSRFSGQTGSSAAAFLRPATGHCRLGGKRRTARPSGRLGGAPSRQRDRCRGH